MGNDAESGPHTSWERRRRKRNKGTKVDDKGVVTKDVSRIVQVV